MQHKDSVYNPFTPVTLLTPFNPVIRHFTATAFIVDSKKRTLLLWHKKMQRWMPPGGHIDENETPEDAAKRECKEETQLDVEIVGDPQSDLFAEDPTEGRMLKKPIAMLLEEIPAIPALGAPAHQHMDFLFIAKPLDETQAASIDKNESENMKWFTKEDVKKLGAAEIFSNVREYILQIL